MGGNCIWQIGQDFLPQNIVHNLFATKLVGTIILRVAKKSCYQAILILR